MLHIDYTPATIQSAFGTFKGLGQKSVYWLGFYNRGSYETLATKWQQEKNKQTLEAQVKAFENRNFVSYFFRWLFNIGDIVWKRQWVIYQANVKASDKASEVLAQPLTPESLLELQSTITESFTTFDTSALPKSWIASLKGLKGAFYHLLARVITQLGTKKEATHSPLMISTSSEEVAQGQVQDIKDTTTEVTPMFNQSLPTGWLSLFAKPWGSQKAPAETMGKKNTVIKAKDLLPDYVYLCEFLKLGPLRSHTAGQLISAYEKRHRELSQALIPARLKEYSAEAQQTITEIQTTVHQQLAECLVRVQDLIQFIERKKSSKVLWRMRAKDVSSEITAVQGEAQAKIATIQQELQALTELTQKEEAQLKSQEGTAPEKLPSQEEQVSPQAHEALARLCGYLQLNDWQALAPLALREAIKIKFQASSKENHPDKGREKIKSFEPQLGEQYKEYTKESYSTLTACYTDARDALAVLARGNKPRSGIDDAVLKSLSVNADGLAINAELKKLRVGTQQAVVEHKQYQKNADEVIQLQADHMKQQAAYLGSARQYSQNADAFVKGVDEIRQGYSELGQRLEQTENMMKHLMTEGGFSQPTSSSSPNSADRFLNPSPTSISEQLRAHSSILSPGSASTVMSFTPPLESQTTRDTSVTGANHNPPQASTQPG